MTYISFVYLDVFAFLSHYLCVWIPCKNLLHMCKILWHEYRSSALGTQCQTNTRSSSTQTDSNVFCANCSLCSGTGNTSRPGLLFAPPSASTPSKRVCADHSIASDPATSGSGRTTPFDDAKDTSYHPVSDDSMYVRHICYSTTVNYRNAIFFFAGRKLRCKKKRNTSCLRVACGSFSVFVVSAGTPAQ